MILVDTSIWIDHLRRQNARLATLLVGGEVLSHPWVIGELALGELAHRGEILGLLGNLPKAKIATDDEVMRMVEVHRLFGLGIGYVDAHLLASTLLSADVGLWTRDKRLASAALKLGVAYAEPVSGS